MSQDLPELYFRVRDNGAAVFRLDTGNRQRRLEMTQIAVINLNSGDIKPHGTTQLTPADARAINGWAQDRLNTLAAREMDEVLRTADHLNITTQWAQSKATSDQLEQVTDDLLMAMHDLRSVLVRKKADRLMKD